MFQFFSWLFQPRGTVENTEKAARDLTEWIVKQPRNLAEKTIVQVFDGMCEKIGADFAKSLPNKAKRTIVRRFLSALRRGRSADFADLVIEQMASLQKSHLRGADKLSRRSMAKSCSIVPISRTAATAEGFLTLAGLPAKTFYKTPEWRRLRAEAFKFYGSHCLRCGGKPSDGVRLHVVHRKQRSLRPDLAFDLKNLWVLCGACRQGELARSRLAREEALFSG